MHTILSTIFGAILSISNYVFGIYIGLIELAEFTIGYMIIFFVLGLICSSLTWKISERIYARHQ